jgi:hypothetical protein
MTILEHLGIPVAASVPENYRSISQPISLETELHLIVSMWDIPQFGPS